MAKHTVKPADGVYLRKDSLKYQWRIKVPADLRSRYGTKQWAHGCSLRTSEVREANRKAALLRAEWLNRFEQQRQQASPSRVDRITPDMVQALADWCKRAVLSVDEGVRTNPRAWSPFPNRKTLLRGMPEHLVDTLREENLEQEKRMAEAVASSRLGEASDIMGNAAADLGIVLSDDAEGLEDALRACLHAVKDAYTARVQRDAGVRVDTPPAPSLKQTTEAQQSFKLREVFGRWKAGKDDAADSVKKKLAALALYEELTTNPPLHELTRDQGDAFRAWLLTDQSARSRRKKDWSSKTKHMIFDDLKTLLNYARRDLEWIGRNPWEGLNIEYETEEERDPWTADQVRTFFGLPLFTKYVLPRTTLENGGPAAYWIPVLGLFTGARIGELCQLRVVDVMYDEGVPCISINKKAPGAKVKNKAGVRLIPLHPELLRLGFLEYVESVAKAGEMRLWPALEVGSTKRKPSSYFSGWFGETVKKVLGEEAPDFHSLRHTVKTKLAIARIPKEEADKIMGWKTKGIGAGYTHYSSAVLLDAVRTVAYPELNLPRVFRGQSEETSASQAPLLLPAAVSP